MSEFEIALLAQLATMYTEMQTQNATFASILTVLDSIDDHLVADNAALVTAIEGVATAVETSEPEASFAAIATSLESLAKVYGQNA